jgi:hypothetical protein
MTPFLLWNFVPTSRSRSEKTTRRDRLWNCGSSPLIPHFLIAPPLTRKRMHAVISMAALAVPAGQLRVPHCCGFLQRRDDSLEHYEVRSGKSPAICPHPN